MIRILVVDDNDIRVEKIKDIFSEMRIPIEQVDFVGTIIQAKRELLKTRYEIMILDVVLPLRADTEPQPNGGLDLLHEISWLETYKLPQVVYVISEYDEAINRLSDIADKISFSAIKYDLTSDDWSKRLQNYIEQFIRADNEQSIGYDYDVAIVCALPHPELHEVKRLPFEWISYNVLGDSTNYYTGNFNGKKLICAAAYEMGMPASAILATKMTEKFKPKYLVMTGIAGGADKNKVNYGDVMIADPSFDYDSGKKSYIDGESVFMPDYRQIRLDDAIKNLIQSLSLKTNTLSEIKNKCEYEKPDNPIQIKIGPFGSGAAVLTDASIIARITKHTRKLLGFDMEAYGVMLAGALSSVPKPIPIVIKSVSDFGDGKDDKYQKYASYTSAKVLELLLLELFRN